MNNESPKRCTPKETEFSEYGNMNKAFMFSIGAMKSIVSDKSTVPTKLSNPETNSVVEELRK